MSLAIITKEIKNLWSILCYKLAFFFFAIKNAKWILLKTCLALATHIVQILTDVFLESFVISSTASWAPNAIEIEFQAFKTSISKECISKCNNFSISSWAITTIALYAKLMMLTKSTILWFFVTENRPNIVRLEWHNSLRQPIFYKASCNACCAFWTECHRSSTFVIKGIHFFCHDVRCFAHTSLEKFGMFKHRRTNFFETKVFSSCTCYSFNIVPFVCFGWKHIFCAFWNVYHNPPYIQD